MRTFTAAERINFLRPLWVNTEGGVALIFSLAVPVLIGLVGLSLDSANFYNQQAQMQAVADSAALSVAKEMHLYPGAMDTLVEVGKSRVEGMLSAKGLEERPHRTDVVVDNDARTASVTLSMVAKNFFPLETWGENPIVVEARARIFGKAKLCVLGLHSNSSDTLKADNGATLTAPECTVQSNSIDPNGMVVKNGSTVVSQFTCTSGGYDGSGYEPLPETDCPALEDPLGDRTPPPAGGCDFLDYVAEKGADNISPGHYCGGLIIKNHADVVAAPGIYIISGGKLEVGNQAVLRGEEVGFYFADDAATLVFKDRALVELSAPKEGPMAGLLFFENRDAQEGRNFEVSSDAARQLLGTIYLPRGTFKSGGAGKIADASAYTIIVARRLDLAGANLVLNADYAASDVPVPPGLGPTSGPVTLFH